MADIELILSKTKLYNHHPIPASHVLSSITPLLSRVTLLTPFSEPTLPRHLSHLPLSHSNRINNLPPNNPHPNHLPSHQYLLHHLSRSPRVLLRPLNRFSSRPALHPHPQSRETASSRHLPPLHQRIRIRQFRNKDRRVRRHLHRWEKSDFGR